MRARAALLVIVFGLTADAAAQTSSYRMTLDVGGTAEVDVDYKIGLRCDDPRLLRAVLRTRDNHNWFVVEGVAAGTTWCRVGTDPNLPSYLFEVVIRAPEARPARDNVTARRR